MNLNWWHNLSVSKKLYSVVGIMGLLIATELFTLFFAMNTLSAVRAFVNGEGLWSKAQKNSVYYLHKYSATKDESQYKLFLEQLSIPLGDHQARIEIEKKNMDMDVVVEGFLRGGNHPEDIPEMIKLVRRFYKEPHLAKALEKWRAADDLIYKYIELGKKVHEEISNKNSNPVEVERLMNEVLQLDAQLTLIENDFSYALGEASRWLENVLMWILISAVILIEGTGLFLTFRFGQSLNKILRELNHAAIEVGKGDFSQRVSVRSKDELGELADSLNKMIISLQKRTKEKQEAENASQTKNLFLANMSHEIRTPLNAILGFSSLLLEPDITEEQKRKYVEIIKRTGNSLNTIINDILDLSKVEAEQIELDLETFSLTQLLSDLQALLTLRSQAKSVQLKFERIGEISEYVYSDQIRLRQILTNLVGNAIKFTSHGEVVLTYQVKNNQIYFTIKDTGPGITKEKLSQLFKPFSQGDDSVRKKYGGTGLGLVISKKLSNLLGGDVGLLESNPGGSIFYARIDYTPVNKREEKKIEGQIDVPKVDLKGKKILLAEDVDDNKILVELFLEQTGVELEFASNGKEAIDLVKNKKFDLILMDVQVPVVDGYSATIEIRKMGIKIPIVALTAYAMKEDRTKCIEVGCNSYLSKPFDRASLVKEISRYFNKKVT